jgi:hypothetical protein
MPVKDRENFERIYKGYRRNYATKRQKNLPNVNNRDRVLGRLNKNEFGEVKIKFWGFVCVCLPDFGLVLRQLQDVDTLGRWLMDGEFCHSLELG